MMPISKEIYDFQYGCQFHVKFHEELTNEHFIFISEVSRRKPRLEPKGILKEVLVKTGKRCSISYLLNETTVRE